MHPNYENILVTNKNGDNYYFVHNEDFNKKKKKLNNKLN
jgi:histidinol phosphatase-like enzyme